MQRHKREARVVVIGGGTGSFTLLSSLKNYFSDITALVNMADSGGSTGLLRDELGVLPPGDIRQCLVALSNSPQNMRELFNYRFPSSSTLSGHSFGNLFLSAVEMMSKNFNDAVQLASQVLDVKGQVLPMTLDNCQLVLKTKDGEITGEYTISKTEFDGFAKPQLYLTPKAKINPLAKKAIAKADLIVIAPGNLYGSLVPALLVRGVGPAIRKSKAKVAYVCNLVNKPNQTKDFAVHDYVSEIERFIGKDAIDYALYNVDRPRRTALKDYAADDEYPVHINEEQLDQAHYQAISGNFLSRKKVQKDPNDTLMIRSLIRHDSEQVSLTLQKLI
jgi:uncharacterized cofD-like protein